MHGFAFRFGLAFGCVLAIGCGSKPTADNAEAPSSTAEAAPGESSPESATNVDAAFPPLENADPAAPEPNVYQAADITLRVVDAAAYRDVISQHKGKVVLVDFWATWCAPCRKHFPHTVELARNHAEQGLQAVSVSFDDRANAPAAVKFLQEQGAAKLDNLLSKSGTGIESGLAFDIVGGAIPFYKLYDRQGELKYQFTPLPEDAEGVLPLDQLDAKVQELLAAPAS